jgi:CRP-like cAMP-binding protein
LSIDQWLPARVQAVGVERTLKAGQSLFRVGMRTAGLYQVVSGKIRLVRIDASGRESVLYSAVAGDVIAEASLFSPVYHCEALASVTSVVRLYPKAAILAEFQRNPKAAQAFMAVLAREIMRLRTRLELGNIHSARDRVRHYLALNATADGQIVLPGTIKELAADLGLSHEALYRTLGAMQRNGEIKRAGAKITLARPYDRNHT